MRPINFSLLALSACILIACGGSGSSDMPKSSSTNASKPNTIKFAGIRAEVSESSGRTKSANTYQASSDINKIVFNGKTIDLVTASAVSNKDVAADQGGSDGIEKVLNGEKYQYSRFGMLQKLNDDTVTFFSQGKLSTDMPTTGRASYAGEYAGIEKQTQNGLLGRVTFAVDFASRTLTADVDSDDKVYRGNISGNTFTSTDGAGKGYFYGPKAAELGGTYVNSEVVAVFGAKKQ